MKSLIFSISLILSFNVMADIDSSTQMRLQEMEARLDDMELNQAVRKLNFSGTFMNQFESFGQRNKTSSGYDNLQPAAAAIKNLQNLDDTYVMPMSMRAELNFDASVSKNLHFYSTLGMSKFWNLSGRTARQGAANGTFTSNSGSYSYFDSRAMFDVAYIHYNFENTPWSLAMGRMTTNNGPPQNQLDGLGRSGTYPFYSYNIILDGVAVIYDMKDWVDPKNSLKARLFYTPVMNISATDTRKPIQDSGDGTGKSDEYVDSHATFMTLLVEYTNRNVSFVDSLDIFYSGFTFDKYYEPSQQVSTTAGDTDIEYGGTISNTLYLGLNKIAGTGLSASLTYNRQDIKSDAGNFSAVLGTGEIKGLEESHNYLFNINYELSGGDIFGAEFIQNDENKVPSDGTTFYVHDFYNAVNGSGYHLFYTHPIGSSQIIRAGMFNWTEGESDLFVKYTDSKYDATYLRWKVFF